MRLSLIITLIAVGGALILTPVLMGTVWLDNMIKTEAISDKDFRIAFMVMYVLKHLVCWVIGTVILAIGTTAAVRSGRQNTPAASLAP